MTAILHRFTQIRREEVAPVLASALSFFFILTALMVLRPAREALGSGLPRGTGAAVPGRGISAVVTGNQGEDPPFGAGAAGPQATRSITVTS